MNQSILKDKMILVVDDYAINCELLTLVVTDAGGTPLVASNGLECVNIVKQQHVDMILIDSNMPVMNGIDATKAIRALPQGKDIVIIGITLYEDDDDAQESLDAGMNLLCPKLALNDEKLIEIGNTFFNNKAETITDTQCEDASHCQLSSKTNSNTECADNLIMDYGQALYEFENDEHLLRSLMVDFDKIIHKQLSVMQIALKNGDFDSIQREAHGIKGGAANLCTSPLSNAAKSLELACREHKEAETIAALLEGLAGTIEIFDRYVRERLNVNEDNELQ